MQRVIVRNANSGVVLADRGSLATSMWARFWGLQFRRSLGDSEALLLRPCTSVHTFFMRFPIDVVFMDRGLTVVKVVSGVKPWRAALGGKGAHCALELRSSSAIGKVAIGDRIELVDRA